MRLHRYPQLLFAFAAATGLCPGCSERSDVARNSEEGTAGSSSEAGGKSGAGSVGSAGGDETRGGAGAGEPVEVTGGAGGEPGLTSPTTILVVGLGAGLVQGTSYVGGVWEPVKELQRGTQGGASVAVLAGGSGIAAMGATAPAFSASRWDGAWTSPVLVPGLNSAQGVPALSRMAAFPGGALVAHVQQQTLSLNTFDARRGAWRLGEDLGVSSAYHPAVSYVGSGDPLVVYFAEGKYASLHKVGSVWTKPSEVPITGEVVIHDRGSNWSDGVQAEIDLARRVGVDEVVGVFATDPTGLDCAVFSKGSWSSAVRIANDAAIGELNIPEYLPSFSRHYSLAALPDGRVALAYWTVTALGAAPSGNIKLGFFDGSSWSDFKVVPDAVALSYSPIAISRGAEGAVLELLFSQNPAADQPAVGSPCLRPDQKESWCLKHMRLTDEADWSWTPQKPIDAGHQWFNISIAATP